MRAIHAWSAAVVAVVAFGAWSSLASANSDVSKQCAVTVDRSMAPDTYQVMRQELDNGDCVCHISTGPQSQSASVEQSIANLQNTGQCGDKPAAIADSGASAPESGKKFPWLIVGGGAGVAGIIAAATSGGNDSTGG